MKIKISELKRIIKEEIEKELHEDENLQEGLKSTLAALGAAMVGFLPSKAAASDLPYSHLDKPAISYQQATGLKSDDVMAGGKMHDRREVHPYYKMVYKNVVSIIKNVKKMQMGDFEKELESKAGVDVEITPATPEEVQAASGVKASGGGAEILSVEGDVVTVKVPIKTSKEVALADARTAALQKLQGKSAGSGTVVSSGTARVIGSQEKDGSLVAKVQVGQ